MAATGVGAAVAVPASIAFAGRPRLAGPAAISFAWAGIPIALVGLVALPAPAIALMVVFGLAFALADSISNALVHRVVDARQLSPSVAAIESSKLLLEGLGVLSAPALIAVLGVRASAILTGALLPALVAVSRSKLLAVDQRAEAHARPVAALRGVAVKASASTSRMATAAAGAPRPAWATMRRLLLLAIIATAGLRR